MQYHELVTKMMDYAAYTKSDQESVYVSRVANKLANHYGLFSEKLTKQDIDTIYKFLIKKH
jgi:UTP-glucose-1-phosphate uridylyltransferase